MVNKKLWLGILVTVLVFGMMVVGCDNDSTGGGTDPALNGTWVNEYEGELILDNGKFEYPGSMKGTYTTNGNSIKITVTHLHGDMMEGDIMELDSKWYTKAELKAAAGPSISDEELSAYFSSFSATYSISGNKLTLTLEGDTETYTKK